ncbi:E3 ubiquitin-protein ligase RNF128 isoform X2 [Triplophysa dalaica]|uniref:E3 ubiquitin-protein ligase RNF128 isoform X2 n=1 Tax=Triplophysa dalaica TaxID=1582913 RepID=UPI0024DFB866|nr:E3 ubiquitin-protein ligase RNF128 isoform X2 [Triplophysa dalaica]
MDNRGRYNSSSVWLMLFVFQCCVHFSASLVYWTAYVEVRYFDRGTNKTVGSICECGVFGVNALVESASGLVVLPNSDPLACSSNTTFSATQKQWVALIKKGNCTYSRKIQAAQRHGASAVVIYNIDGTGNDTNLMEHSDADDTVTIMIGNILGTKIASLTENGTDVYMAIVVANAYGLWLWAYALFFAFTGITAASVCYFTFLFIKRLYINHQLRIQQREIKREAKNAIEKLQVRTLRRGDPEVDSEDICCVVCTDAFKRDEKVTVLPCRHLYHKKCIEPWFLEHPTCPICKYNILKSKIDEDSNVMTSTSASQHDTSHSNIQTVHNHVHYDVDVQTQHIYQNPAFEDSVIMHQD